MTVDEAIVECERWLRHLDRQRDKMVKLQELARLAKTNPEEARRQKRQLDSQPRVYDGANLQVAVERLIEEVRG